MITSISQNKNLKKYAKPLAFVLSAVFWLLVWQIIYLIVGSDVIVASPIATFTRVFELAATGQFWLCVGNSILNVLIGFALALCLSIFLAALSNRFIVFEYLFSPLIKLVRATPVASFIVLALFWLDDGVPSFIVFLMVVPLIYSNLTVGLKNVDKNLLEMAQIYKFSFLKKIRLIYIPSLMPYFVSACSVGLGFGWKAGIAAEVIGLPKNTLGLEIYNSKIYIETIDLFALTAVIIILSILLEKVFMFLLSRLSKRILKGGAEND